MNTGTLRWQLVGLATVLVFVIVGIGEYAKLRNEVDYQTIPITTRQCIVELDTPPAEKAVFRKTVEFTFAKGSTGGFAKIGLSSNKLLVCDSNGTVLMADTKIHADTVQVNSESGGDPPSYVENLSITELKAPGAVLDGHRQAQYTLFIYVD